jgi:hypothetical protein
MMRWVGHVECMKMRNTFTILVEEPEGKGTLESLVLGNWLWR